MKVVKFLFSSCCHLPFQRVVSSVMLFDGLSRKNLFPAMLLYVFVMIAVCCQTHKNLNCSIKSPLSRGMKALKARKYQTCVYFTFDSMLWNKKETDCDFFKVFSFSSTCLAKLLTQSEGKFNKWIFNCNALQKGNRKVPSTCQKKYLIFFVKGIFCLHRMKDVINSETRCKRSICKF